MSQQDVAESVRSALHIIIIGIFVGKIRFCRKTVEKQKNTT